MNKEFFKSLELLEEEYGIPRDYMVEKIKDAMVSALKKEYNKPNINVRVDLNSDKEDLTFYRQRTVVEEVLNEDVEISLEDAKRKSKRYKIGDTYENEIKAKELRRTSAGAARQVIISAIREAHKKATSQRLENKRESIISAKIKKINSETGDVLISFDEGKYEAVLLAKEQIPGEELRLDQVIRVFIQEVDKRGGGTSATISRRHTSFLRRLFELEVPEIASGDVILSSIARDPGSRSKVSVYSRADGIDAIGACIGQNKVRIESIVRELAGEKVDIIPFSEDKAEYIKAALSPAAVEGVIMLEPNNAKVYVTPDQLSLAIGKAGQNVRLAAKLTGCKIDITDNYEVFEEAKAFADQLDAVREEALKAAKSAEDAE